MKRSANAHCSSLEKMIQGVVTLLLLFLMAGCDAPSGEKIIDLKETISSDELQKKHSPYDSVMNFGFDLRRSVEEDTRQYVPFLKYLEEVTGIKFKLRFTPEDAHIADDLGTGVLQFAAIGADTYITAQEQYGVIPMVRGLNANNKAEYQSVLITAPDSPIETIEDLRDKRFAFGSKTSTQGHLIPRIILAQHGITLNNLSGYQWTGSHSNCANEVAAGNFDAGGMQDTLGKDLADAGLVKIFYTSRYYPSSGIAANKNVSADIIAKVKNAMIAFDPQGRDAHRLYNWDKTEMPNGFSEAADKDYSELREWSKKLNLIQ